MAVHTSKKLLLCFSRLNVVGAGFPNVSSRLTYATAFQINMPGKKNFPERDGSGTFNKKRRTEAGPPRTEKMTEDQDWTVVYPAAAPFRAGTVPLPVRMGYPIKGGAPPEKQGNLELIKIPNFLHLTPAAIRKHCEALKPFCNAWPSALDTDAKCEEHFPIQVESNDYLSAGLSIRNPAARVVHLRVKLSSLNLDDHARKKMLKLVGERYCKDTDVLTIRTDSCPLRRQNYDYAMYLLTVVYHESWKTEAWEADKTVADMEEYSWEDSPSQKNILDTLLRQPDGSEEERERLLGRSEMQAYKDSVTRLKNQGDSEGAVLQYKEAVKKVLKL
ncbi:small ribosomal subunit protein mS35 [Corythoichthys intestinalis]|uniref:small ribosomal subunit protein mS35 n=1 Tax=Corythoichthys intestinalis TaxID=161448 RepID=UPI0025A5D16F|nr:28S ribosomal protein S35, mitochondrial [Corythoichthys intestinalis]XP_061813250.1 small ribosomal subunit protein mS35-like [Nerophis lumbriciformis]